MKRCCNKHCRKEFDTPGCQCQECRDRVTKPAIVVSEVGSGDMSNINLPLSLLALAFAGRRTKSKDRKYSNVGETVVLK